MIGELGALACAPLWAISSILLKSQTDKVDAVKMNAIRGLFAAAFAVAVFLVTGRISLLGTLSFYSIAHLLLAVVVSFVLGDTLFIMGMAIIGVSKALPMSIIYPVFVLPFSVTIVGESLTILAVAGVFVVIAGLYMITAPQSGSEQLSELQRKQYWWGVFLILAATLCWAGGTVFLHFAMVELDPILAGAIRMPFMTLVLLVVVYFRRGSLRLWDQGLRSFMILGLAGAFGIGLGGLLFMVGVKYAGPAKTAILSATAPLFGVPLSMFTLKEKITLKIVIGTVLCVIGIWFVFL